MDLAIVHALQGSFGVSPLMAGIGIFFASALIWISAGLCVLFWLLDRRARTLSTLAAFIAAGMAWLINQGIGELYFRVRPFAIDSSVLRLIEKSGLEKSFPSDHAAIAFALATAVFLVSKRWGWTLLSAAALISLARVYAGVHYLSDVIAGAIIGTACAILVHGLIHHYLRTKHHA